MRLTFVLLAVLTLASCGGSSATSSRPGSAASAAAAGTRSIATGALTTTPSSSSSTGTAPRKPLSGPAPCVGAGLALSFLGQNGGLGHGELGFALRNVSGASCRTYGYPGILFLDRAGTSLPTVPARTTHDFFGGVPVTALVLAPGASASFRLGVTHVAPGSDSSKGCGTAFGLQAIAPDDTATLRTTMPGGAYECRTATVSPLARGHSAYP